MITNMGTIQLDDSTFSNHDFLLTFDLFNCDSR